MKVGVLGSGAVGRALSKGFVSQGHQVMVGTRDSENLRISKEIEEDKIDVGSFEECAKFGEIIVLAVKGKFARDVLIMAGEENLKDKIIIDTTNPIADSAPENGVLKFFTSLDRSLMEELQEGFLKARFVKAFNSIGSAFMVNPNFGKDKPSMFICGNDENAKSKVREILEVFGFEVEDMGKVESARALEPLCILWCIPGFLRNDWSHAFKLLKT